LTVLVVVETMVLVLLTLLVAGLLRSHAEILRRLDARESAPSLTRPARSEAALRPALRTPAPARANAPPGHDIAGVTLRGEPVQIGIRSASRGTLLAFLTSGCATCRGFWDGLQPDVRPLVPGGARLVVVTKDSSYESPSKLRSMAPADLPVVMSSDAWEAYQVPGSPYFVYVDGASGRIHGEGMAGGWAQVLSLLQDAISDAEVEAGVEAEVEPGVDASAPVPSSNAHGFSLPEAPGGSTGRASRAERELRTAGIGEGHSSLYAADDPSSRGTRGG
jgi:hypothetical protein